MLHNISKAKFNAVFAMFRELSTEKRSLDLTHTIDPGFVNRRLVQTIIGDAGIELVDKLVSQIPPLPEGVLEVRIDHAYNRVALLFCEAMKIKTLGELLATESGDLFCSTEEFLPCAEVYDQARASSTIQPPGNAPYSIVLEYSTSHIRSDTLRHELSKGAKLSAIAHFDRKNGDTLYFHPLIIGGPWLNHDDKAISGWAMFQCHTFYEHFVEDFDEFAKVKETPQPVSFEPMKEISEKAFKKCLAKLLGDDIKKDWGGETSDHFTSNLHVNGRRVTGAFLLKGPSRFAPMGLNHLGKNNDQICRLSHEPADVLFVQHCHEIEPAVRATLRAFSVQPGRPRRYCLIDGKDSLRLLWAYGLYDEAVRLSQQQ